MNQLIFEDTFQTAVAPRLWSHKRVDGRVTKTERGEKQIYTPDNLYCKAGTGLVIRPKKAVGTPEPGKLKSDGTPQTYDYTSGQLQGWGMPWFKYGYFEVCFKPQTLTGGLLAIWLLADNWPCEIDIMEMLLSDITKSYQTVHGGPAYPENCKKTLLSGGHTVPYDASGYTKAGLLWTPEALTWYSGKPGNSMNEIGKVTDPMLIPHVPMYPIINVSMGGSWEGTITDAELNGNNEFPDQTIRYFRVYDVPGVTEDEGIEMAQQRMIGA